VWLLEVSAARPAAFRARSLAVKQGFAFGDRGAKLLVRQIEPTVGPGQDAGEDSPSPGVIADVRRSPLHVVRPDEQRGVSG